MDNPDFMECDVCGGEFYRGDLDDGVCQECQADADEQADEIDGEEA